MMPQSFFTVPIELSHHKQFDSLNYIDLIVYGFLVSEVGFENLPFDKTFNKDLISKSLKITPPTLRLSIKRLIKCGLLTKTDSRKFTIKHFNKVVK